MSHVSHDAGTLFKTAFIGVAAPAALNVAIQVSQSATAEQIILSTGYASIAGGFGLLTAAIAGYITGDVLHRKYIDGPRWDNIMLKVTAAAYAVPVTCTLAFNGLVSPDQMENEEELPAVDEVIEDNSTDGPDIERCKNAQGENALIIEIPAEHIQTGEQETVVLSCEA